MKFERVGYCALSFLVFLIFLLASSNVIAEWEIKPSIKSTIGYSDNIELDSDDEESGFIGEINPGINISKTNGRLQVALDYSMKNFYYFKDSQLDTDHDLDAVARFAILPRTFFINTFARAEQVLIDNDQQISVNNFNDTGNTTDEYSYGIGPQWIQDFGAYARADVSYLYSEQKFDDETADGSGEGDIDDNDRQNFTARLSNINQEADNFDWALVYEREDVDFDFGDNFEFITQQVDVGYRLTSFLELLGTYGYEDNDLGNNVAFNDDDGTFWNAGVALGLGEFTVLEVRRGERFFGNFWLGELTIGGPRLSVNASYEEVAEVVSSRELDFGFDNEIDAFDILDNDVDFSQDDRNSASVSKNWTAGITYQISKSTLLATYSNEDEEFLDSTDTEKLEIYTLGWVWRRSANSALTIIAEYQEDESFDTGTETESDFLDFDVAYVKNISPKTALLVNYTYSEGDSDFNDDKFTSNTIAAGVEIKF